MKTSRKLILQSLLAIILLRMYDGWDIASISVLVLFILHGLFILLED